VSITAVFTLRLFNSKKKAQGRITRDKTTQNRLRRVDIFLVLYAPELIRSQKGDFQRAFFVDLGFGRRPLTTLESARALRRLHPGMPVLGIDIDKTLVEQALCYQDEITFFRHGGFNLPLQSEKGNSLEKVRIIRAFNVLRQYNEEEVPGAYKILGSYLLPGGILIEGTSDPLGRIWTCHLIRKQSPASLVHEAMVFSTNFKESWSPGVFQPVLPKNDIHRMIEGEEIYTFFDAWKGEYKKSLSSGVIKVRQLFIKSCLGLKEQGYAVETRKKWLGKGFLIWKRNKPLTEPW
jgi:hypothetical protein